MTIKAVSPRATFDVLSERPVRISRPLNEDSALPDRPIRRPRKFDGPEEAVKLDLSPAIPVGVPTTGGVKPIPVATGGVKPIPVPDTGGVKPIPAVLNEKGIEVVGQPDKEIDDAVSISISKRA